MGRPSVSDSSTRHPFGCCLLGVTSHRLDSYHLGGSRRDSLEPALGKRIAPVCLLPGPRRNWANAVVLNGFLAGTFCFFTRPRPPLSGWSTMVRQVALTYTGTIIVALAAQQAGRSDLIRSPKRVLAHTWEGF